MPVICGQIAHRRHAHSRFWYFAASVARKLGHRHYVPLSYSRKFWFDDGLSMPVSSITVARI
ncbi:MAG: hypothetical protein WDM77_14745 [Steroidobacteraceae bacterium]